MLLHAWHGPSSPVGQLPLRFSRTAGETAVTPLSPPLRGRESGGHDVPLVIRGGTVVAAIADPSHTADMVVADGRG